MKINRLYFSILFAVLFSSIFSQAYVPFPGSNAVWSVGTKKFLLTLFSIICFANSKAQVVFCPPGAEWHYTFSSLNWFIGAFVSENVPVKYAKDSLVDNEQVKVLTHGHFFSYCGYGDDNTTLIKQHGDTVFMRNINTQNKWQVLYNFAAMPGDNWVNTLSYFTNSVTVYNTVVDSINYTVINGFNLRQLHITYRLGTSMFAHIAGTGVITERIGVRNRYLFNYATNGPMSCDFYNFNEFLCYQDNQFGLKKFTSKPCEFSNLNGEDEEELFNSMLKVFPNPTGDLLQIEFENEVKKSIREIKIYNNLGQLVKELPVGGEEKQLSIKTADLPEGVYFIHIIFPHDKGDNSKEIISRKFVVSR
jgi:hypothetical protein